MDSDETAKLRVVASPPETTPAAAPDFQHCDECGAPVDAAQRYCVNCGAHRRNVPDPSARYLSQSSARNRAASGARTRATTQRRQGGNLALALVIALIPVAAVLGVEIGRSSNNGDPQLIRALEARQGASTVTQTTTTEGASSSAGGSASTTGKHTSKNSTSKRSSGSRATSTTSNGTATQITGSKVTSSEEQQGAAEAQKVQNSTGSSYVQANNNLPSTVVP